MKLYKSLLLLLPLSTVLVASDDIDVLLNDLSSPDYDVCQEARLGLYSAAAEATSSTAKETDRQDFAAEITEALMDPESVTQAKVFLTRILTRIGTESSAEALIKVSQDKKLDPVVREHAILAVSAISGESVTKQIVKALKNAGKDYQNDWWQAIGHQTAPGSVKLLINQVGDSSISDNPLAITALGKIGGKDAAEFLADQIGKSKTSLLPVLEKAILNTKGSDAAILSALIKSPSSPAVEIAAFEQLLKQDSDAAQGHLKSLIKQPSSQNRQKAIRLALDTNNKKLRNFIVSQLNQLPADEVDTVLTAIGEQEISDYEELVIGYLNDESTQVQIAALKALARIGSSTCTDELLKLVKSDDEDIQDLAIYALAQIDDPQMDAEIVRNVKDKNSSDRENMIELVAIRNSSGATEVINGILEQGADDPQIASILSAVEKIGDVDSCRILVRLLINNPDRSYLRKVQLSLKRLTIRLALDDYLWKNVLLPGLQLASSQESKANIVEILDCLSSDKALTFCTDCVKNKHQAKVRTAAMSAIRRWTSLNIGEYWTDVIKDNTSSDTDLKNAKAAMVRLVKSDSVDGSNWDKANFVFDTLLEVEDEDLQSQLLEAISQSGGKSREFNKQLNPYDKIIKDWDKLKDNNTEE